MRERRVVHVRLPRDAEGHLAVQVPFFELRGGGVGAEDTVERARVGKDETHVVDVGHERLIGDLKALGLEDHGTQKDQIAEGAWSTRGHVDRTQGEASWYRLRQ